MEDESAGFPRNNYDNKGISFISFVRWVFLDQSNVWRTSVCWSVFFVLAIVVPLVSHLLLYSDHPYHIPVQLSLSVIATLSFLCLSRWDRKYGITNFLLFDKVCHEAPKIQRRYALQLQRTMKVMLVWGLPCFVAECGYKIWWYMSVSGKSYNYGDNIIYIRSSSIILCVLQLSSWVYRVSIFLVVCVVFGLICYLQILKLENLSQLLLHQQTELGLIMMEHLKMRRNLRIISHRFRAFIVASLFLVTLTHLVFLLITTRLGAHLDIDLMLVSISLVSGVFIVLRSATKMTHKAQSNTCLASKWHIFSTITSFQSIPNWGSDEDDDDVGDEEDDLDNSKKLPLQTHTVSFQKRQALVTYMENNRAGMTVFGFVVDRTCLHSIFALQFALCLWLLNKTIGQI
ncbi:extracellular ligand-gated ion channel protein [Senna tora]|uniref:Extracellular ligand-gated ion channel protein n=1 Tax=Senna tora TaxID=362788 RepID=A0A834SD92_9FABA|nr:extracellular ligand-gated ion channel protein [Senna tora]